MAYEILSLGNESTPEPFLATPARPQQPSQGVPTSKQPSSLSSLARGAGGLALRAGEAIVGFPGDVVHGVTGLVDTGLKKLTGVSPSELNRGIADRAVAAWEKLTGAAPDDLSTRMFRFLSTSNTPPLPTSTRLREKGKTLFGDQFEPQSDVERNLQEFVSTVAPMMFGGGIGRALISGGAGQLAKFGAEKLGAPEWAQNTVKTGAMLGASLIGIPTMESFAKDLYQKAEELVPRKFPVPAADVFQEVREIRNRISGRNFPQKKTLLKNLDAIKGPHAIEGKVNILSEIPSIPAEKMWQLKKDINEWLRAPVMRRAPTVRTELSKMSSLLGDALKQGTAQRYPEFSKAISEADDIWRTIRGTEKASTVISSAVQNLGKKLTPTSIALFAHLFKGRAASAAGLFGAAKVGSSLVNAIKASINTPGVRRYYKTILKDALNGNQPAVMNGLRRFDRSLQKEMDKQNLVGEPETRGYEILSLGDQGQ